MNSNTFRAVAWTLAACACSADARGPLRLVTRSDGPARGVETRLLESFIGSHPGVRIARVARGPGDVVLLDGNEIARVVQHGGALDLASYLPRVGVELPVYDSAALEVVRRGAHVYALPRGYSPVVLAFNKTLFDSVGLAYPSDAWTWDDFIAAAEQLTRDTDGDGTVDQWGTYFDPRVNVWLPWLLSAGGDVLCADGARASGCLDAPASRTALRWIADWIGRDGIAPPTTAVTGPPFAESLRLFGSGRVAMATADHSWIPALQHWAEARGLRAGFALIPHRPGFASATAFSTAAYAVSPLTLRRKLAVELTAALTDSVAQQLGEDAGYELPAMTRGGAELVASDTLGWDTLFLRAAVGARPPWGARVGNWPQVEMRLREMMERIAHGADLDRLTHETASQLDTLVAGAR